MAAGRNSVCVSILTFCFFINAQFAFSTTFMVGDAAGWSFDSENWAVGKSFKAGDILEFKYSEALHNVVVVDEASYNSCTVPSGARTYQTGDDKITLENGENYFICGVPGHCLAGMKTGVTID